MDMLKIAYLTAGDGIKDASFRFIENILMEVTLKGTMDYLFIRNLEREAKHWSLRKPLQKGFLTREASPTP